MKYLKAYKIFEDNNSEEFYKDLTDKIFYDVNEYFVEEKGRFMPIKVMLGKNKDNSYYGSLCLGPGWSGRMDEDEEDWLFDLVRTYRQEHGIDFGLCGDSFGHGYFYERTNNAWADGKNFDNLPDYPFPERLE